MNKDDILIMFGISIIALLILFLGMFIGTMATKEHYKEIMIKNNMAEYRINPKTGGTTFYIFERE